MDVAQWEKHRIKRELEGFGLYSMVFVGIQWYFMVYVGIHRDSYYAHMGQIPQDGDFGPNVAFF